MSEKLHPFVRFQHSVAKTVFTECFTDARDDADRIILDALHATEAEHGSVAFGLLESKATPFMEHLARLTPGPSELGSESEHQALLRNISQTLDEFGNFLAGVHATAEELWDQKRYKSHHKA